MHVPFLSFTYQNAIFREDFSTKLQLFFDQETYVLGPEVAAFETAYAAFNKTSYCVGVGNGLDALMISLEVANIQPGEKVIVPANTYIATWLAVSQVGAIPVPVEPDPITYNLDPARIEAALTSSTKAILPVHLYGQPCSMSAIMDIANAYNLFVIEDNAQAHGATWNGQLTGSFGQVNATSFYPTKNLGALGDAGAITTNHPELARQVRLRRNYGSETKNENVVIGRNSRLDEMQAAVLNLKLPFLLSWTNARRQIAEIYYSHLSQIPEIILPAILPEAEPVYHLFVIRTKHRSALQAYLHKQQIETAIHYPVPPHLQPVYQFLNFKQGSFPITEELAATSLSLPIWPGLTTDMVEYVCTHIQAFFRHH